MSTWVHRVQYYETDQMKITHHSNYIRWLEEARVDFLQKIGFPLEGLEERGLVCPVVSLEFHYKKTTTFGEKITVELSVSKCKGVRLEFSYCLRNSQGDMVASARSAHCFLGPGGEIINLKREEPDFFRCLCLEMDRDV